MGVMVSYYGGGPDWAMIGARRRAEHEASSARSDAGRWRERAEALAALVYEMADRTSPAHTAGDCPCRSCWEGRVAQVFGTGAPHPHGPAPGNDPFWNLVNKVSREADERRRRKA
ncbi:hypothetical protein SSCG_01852 [Streptomyces clavuligerus]|nr:hypothetical protein SSCG_01852 [Streptomyces clavuligerus]